MGDQQVRADQWLGGPLAPSRIEGISIKWPDKPDNLDIRYAVKTAKPQPTSGIPVKVGSFSGTRGKDMPVVALLLEMSGAADDNLQFAVDTLFLGAPTKRVVGRRIVSSGPTGREPLVGLRVSIGNVSADKRAVAKASADQPTEPEHAIRVFRNRPKLASQPRNYKPGADKHLYAGADRLDFDFSVARSVSKSAPTQSTPPGTQASASVE
jgi:hypothetical protein